MFLTKFFYGLYIFINQIHKANIRISLQCTGIFSSIIPNVRRV